MTNLNFVLRARLLSTCAIIILSIDESLQCNHRPQAHVDHPGCKTLGERNLPCGDATTLKVAQIVFRHGDRTPIFTYPMDPYKNCENIWSLKRGELTKVGAQQLHAAGRYYRRRYSTFISESYSSKEVYVTSSNVDRSISSAQAFLSGFFPGDCITVVPIHDIPSEKDNKIHFSAPHLKCPAYDNVIGKLQDTLKKKYSCNDKRLFEYLTKNTGVEFSTWLQVYKLYDTLYIQDLHKLELPNWTTEVYPNVLREVAQKIPSLTLSNTRLLKLRGGPLLSLILNRFTRDDVRRRKGIRTGIPNMEDSMLSDIRAKMYIYSGHESTIITLLSALGIFQNHIPPYASSVIMELHSPKKGKCGRDYIQVLYRNDSSHPPYLLKIPGCPPPCYLEQLKKIKANILVDTDWEWVESCHDLQYNSIYEYFHDCSCETAYGFVNLHHGIKLFSKKLYSKMANWIVYMFTPTPTDADNIAYYY